MSLKTKGIISVLIGFLAIASLTINKEVAFACFGLWVISTIILARIK